MTAEQIRVERNNRGEEQWDLWGPYVSERAWGTVREDYSDDGDAWNYFPHEHARSRAYRWNEDGIAGISDFKQRLCFAFAFWNERDPILKERFFGLTGPQGNHGEDVKEVYFYDDNTPSHSYMRMTYRYACDACPNDEIVRQNRLRTRQEPEFELADTGVFDGGCFDIEIEYAKRLPRDLLIRATITNASQREAALHLLPTLWFRNTWGWGRDDRKPLLRASRGSGKLPRIDALHHVLGKYALVCEEADALLFTENETNTERLWKVPNTSPFTKDAFHEFLVDGRSGAVNPQQFGTKAAAHLRLVLAPGERRSVRLRLQQVDSAAAIADPFESFDETFALRSREADEFYETLAPASLIPEHRAIQRQALAGMLWSKQFYHYVVEQWLEGDPGQPAPAEERKRGRNWEWRHLHNERVMSMPDKWEYPWYASWDIAFHCIPLALVDPQFAKDQLDLITREWYQHPNGQIPAYEWNFSDVNPPVIGWAAWRVYKMEQRQTGRGDRAFLETIFHKMLIAFTWWVNRKDSSGNNIFEGGFLGLDNIGVFDRSMKLPGGGHLEQSDATSWMGMFSLNLMRIALELARENPVYENIATKFFEHFLAIAGAMNNAGGKGIGLWDEDDEFFYDVLHLPDGRYVRMRVRSLVGLMPLLAVETIEPELLEAVPGFKSRLEWYLENRPDLAALISRWHAPGSGERRLIALTRGHRMKRLLRRMLDPEEFLSPYGVRSMSKYHEQHPFVLQGSGEQREVRYEPAESQSGVFGGNSNWRGPVWMPINYLLIESLQKFHRYYGDDFKVECPTGSGNFQTLECIANELSNRLISLWLPDANGNRPFAPHYGCGLHPARDRDRYLFHEYFNGDTGAGLGASHQTGWTGLVAKLIQQQGSLGTIAKPDPFTDL
ncbi:MAG: GH63 [uncultured Chthoniobacterales bacterium]|uniref:GH63 n=1 Tax=uncultured Chthoniobacterales bacterium TaxID=1836801 RepID=A0A6J4I2D4_9BACT|nr:MAG: GH63 [uncultured Chthoniobacterales bacterium]